MTPITTRASAAPITVSLFPRALHAKPHRWETEQRVEPDIQYARNDGVAIAYQVVGDADRDLVFVPDFISNLVYGWESPYWREFYERLARSFRLILFDKRGTGLSDRGGAGFAALETRMDDMRVVLDAAGSERAVVVGGEEGGQMAALYAATHPDATAGLVLFQPLAHIAGVTQAEVERFRETMRRWGTQRLADEMLAAKCPTLLRSEADRVWFANWLRVGASPEIGLALNLAYGESDVRDVLTAIRVPTLVLHRTDETAEDAAEAAALIPGALLERVDGSDNWGIFLSPQIVDRIEAFAATLGAEPEPASVLATILFTDLVGSTAKAAELGDRGWRDLLAEHHARVRRELARHRGVELDTAGDGFFARFDGPGTGDPLRWRDPCLVGRDRTRSARGPPHRGMRGARRQGCRDCGFDRRAGSRRSAARRGARLADREGPGRRLGAHVRGAWRNRAEGGSGRVAAVFRGASVTSCATR